MLFGLWAANRWIGAERQKSSLINFGVETNHLVGIEDRDTLINKRTRTATKDRIAVERLFVVATTVNDLQDCITRAHARRVFFDEVASGRHSDDLQDLMKMLQDAQLAYGGRWLDPERASAMGLKARGVTNGRKAPGERMPNAQAQKILNNHDLYGSIPEALHTINADERYPLKWSRSFVYREQTAGRLDLIERHKGFGWKK